MKNTKKSGAGNIKSGNMELRGKKSRRKVSPRKELAVVTIGMVATIAGFGGLLGAAPPQTQQTEAVSQAAPASKPAPDAGASSQAKPVARQTPVYSPVSQNQTASAPQVQSQGS